MHDFSYHGSTVPILRKPGQKQYMYELGKLSKFLP